MTLDKVNLFISTYWPILCTAGWLFMAVVSKLPPPTEKSPRAYRWFYAGSHLISANLDKIEDFLKSRGVKIPSQASKLGCLALVLLVPLAGCTKKSVSPQVALAQSTWKASQAAKTIADLNNSTFKALAILQGQHAIDAATANEVLARLQGIAEADDQAIAVIKAAEAGDTSANWKGALLAVVGAGSNTDPTVFGIKSTGAQRDLALALGALNVAIAGLTTSF